MVARTRTLTPMAERFETVPSLKQFQMFDLYVLKEWPVKDVARALGVSTTHVYVTKHRVAGMIKAELKRLESKIGTKPRIDTN